MSMILCPELITRQKMMMPSPILPHFLTKMHFQWEGLNTAVTSSSSSSSRKFIVSLLQNEHGALKQSRTPYENNLKPNNQ